MAAAASMPLAPPMSSARAPVNKWLVAVSVTFGTLMGTIDASIVNVAVPHLRGAMARRSRRSPGSRPASSSRRSCHAAHGVPGRLFGQKNVYLSCLVLFIVGSALCGMARSLTTLVAFRVIQGFGAGALQPTEQAILRQTFPPEEQGMAMAVFGMAVMIGPALGPTLGGYIVDNYSWPWIFYINVPVGLLATFMVVALRPRAGGHPARQPGGRGKAAQAHGLGRDRAPQRGPGARSSTRSRRGSATTGSSRRSSGAASS